MNCENCRLRYVPAGRTKDGKDTFSPVCQRGETGGCPEQSYEAITQEGQFAGSQAGASRRPQPVVIEDGQPTGISWQTYNKRKT